MHDPGQNGIFTGNEEALIIISARGHLPGAGGHDTGLRKTSSPYLALLQSRVMMALTARHRENFSASSSASGTYCFLGWL
jgi:hypothetical protein